MSKISTCLWFDGDAEEAANFYVSVFKDSKMGAVSRYSDAAAKVSGRPPGSVLTIQFEINGREFMALNGGPQFQFSEAISFVVNCETQDEIDEFWRKLSAGGKPGQCGWLKDKFGLSWQIVPNALAKLVGDPDPQRTNRVMEALLQMHKIDIGVLQRAYDNAL